jgi:nitroreductase
VKRLRDDTDDLTAALARARTAEPVGPPAPAGPRVPARPGPALTLPAAGPGETDLDTLLRLSLTAADRSGRLRPAPSAGALHPVDTELLTGAGCPLPPGRYGYDPVRHRVHHLGPAPSATPAGTVTAVLTGTLRRTASHYGHRARPLVLLDTGHTAAALLLAARALGTTAEVHLDGLAEAPLATVRIAPPPARPPARGLPHRGLPGPPPRPAELLARRSTPPPLPGTPPTAALRDVLATATRAGGPGLRWCAAIGGPRPGLVELGPGGRALHRCASGETRPVLAAWAAGQSWIAHAGALLLARGCPAGATPTHIRRTHLRAGYAVHLAQFSARRHHLAARPVGSWQQADLGAALGGPPGRDWIIHALALGTDGADRENPR